MAGKIGHLKRKVLGTHLEDTTNCMGPSQSCDSLPMRISAGSSKIRVKSQSLHALSRVQSLVGVQLLQMEGLHCSEQQEVLQLWGSRVVAIPNCNMVWLIVAFGGIPLWLTCLEASHVIYSSTQ